MSCDHHVRHDLTLHFDRVLSEAEWRTVVEYIAHGPVRPARLVAHAHLGQPVEATPAIYLSTLRQMYEDARETFLATVNVTTLDPEAQHFVRSLANAIGEISPGEAQEALERFLAERTARHPS